MASFRCYDNSDVVATLIMKNFYLYLIQLWWQFCQMFVYGDGSLCSNLAGIDPEKLYRGTFICQDGLCCCIVWPSFLFDCFVKIWATCMNFLGKWFTAPPWPKIARTPMKSVMRWINHHKEERLPVAAKIIEAVRLGLVDVGVLIEELNTEEIQKVPEIHKILIDASLYFNAPSQMSKFAEKTKPRTPGQVKKRLYLSSYFPWLTNQRYAKDQKIQKHKSLITLHVRKIKCQLFALCSLLGQTWRASSRPRVVPIFTQG